VTAGVRSPLVAFDGAAFSYGGHVAVEADLELAEGCFVGLVGPSGAGKTTLLRGVLGQLRPVRGEVRVAGERVVAFGPPTAAFTHAVLRDTFSSDMVVFRHEGALVVADAPAHFADHPHHAHVHHGADHPVPAPNAGHPVRATEAGETRQAG
jgi:ABC-type transporter Mla maintaining outer membrane lipid asymmetry ATPase subunit MlaF